MHFADVATAGIYNRALHAHRAV